MTCTKEQVRKLMRYRKTHPLEVAAAKAGMTENTARKYFKRGGKILPAQERDYRTRRDPFGDVWCELQEMLENDANLHSPAFLRDLFW